MKKMKQTYWVFIGVVLGFIIKVDSVFARIGSSGGHHGGGYSGGHTSYGSHNERHGGFKISMRQYIVFVFFLTIIFEYILLFFGRGDVTPLPNKINFLLRTLKHRMNFSVARLTLSPKVSIDKFKRKIRKNTKIKWTTNTSQIDTELETVYTKLQEEYVKGLASSIAKKKIDKKSMLEFASRCYLNTVLLPDIWIKKSKRQMEKVVINRTKVVKIAPLNSKGNVILAKVRCRGIDEPVDLDIYGYIAPKTKTWIDYVVYAKDEKQNSWKIINIIYGDKFDKRTQ